MEIEDGEQTIFISILPSSNPHVIRDGYRRSRMNSAFPLFLVGPCRTVFPHTVRLVGSSRVGLLEPRLTGHESIFTGHKTGRFGHGRPDPIRTFSLWVGTTIYQLSGFE